MNAPLRVLIVEDSESDAALAVRFLNKAGYAVSYERVETAEEMRSALSTQSWDVVISDYNLPQFDAPASLAILKESDLDIPFIIVSGTVGEETAVTMMKLGAHDYLMKGKLVRLAPAVEREIREAKVRAERQAVEKRAHRHLSRLTALHSIDLSINSTFDLDATLSAILDQTVAQLDVDAAAIFRFNAQTLTLDYAVGYGFHSAVLQEIHLRLADGSAGRAALEPDRIDIPAVIEAGEELARALRSAGEVLNAYYGAPLIVKGEIKGVLATFKRTSFQPDDGWLSFLDTLAGQAAIAIDIVELFDRLQSSNIELASAYDATLAGWSHALDLRDKDTEGHTQRVVEMTLGLAREMGVSAELMVHIRRGALLHDIGKLGIPDGILLKPGPLTDEEWMIMRRHPVFAYEWLKPIAYLQHALDIPYCHHEKWDGSGYPRQLKGPQFLFLPAFLRSSMYGMH